ncbi:MAG: hypothetical protein AB7T06_32355 [Kofleriaceae bacterium]
MTTTASLSSPLARAGSTSANPFTATAAPSSLRSKALAAAAILAVFTAYSMWVVLGFGYTGFLSLAMREPWAMQLLLDLVLACTFGIGWMTHDARARRIATWPFVIATLFLGSVGLLGYVVWRGFAVRPRPGT